MLTRLETVVNQWHSVLALPAGLTRLRSLSLNCGAGDAQRVSMATLPAVVAAMPCLTTLRLALWSTQKGANLSALTQLKVVPATPHCFAAEKHH